MVTMREVAQQAGVSQSTVSFVLNNRRASNISDETRERVRQVAHRLGYSPNRIARALALGRTEMIGLWIRSLHSTYYTQFVHDIDSLITQSEYKLMVSRNAGVSGVAPEEQDFPVSSVDGIVAVDIPGTVGRFIRTHAKMPLVQVGTHFHPDSDYVNVQLGPATREAIEHLWSHGRRRIAYLADNPTLSVGFGARFDVYRGSMRESGQEEIWIRSDWQSHNAACEAVLRDIRRGLKVDAIMCLNDDMAAGANRALHELGVRIPDDIALVGCDNVVYSSYLHPALSTIEHPSKQVCSLAWEFLLNRIRNPEVPLQHVELPAQFVPRASTVG
jgi:DNA-binding LacI/PurR family transcriptional regulator